MNFDFYNMLLSWVGKGEGYSSKVNFSENFLFICYY